MSKAARLNPYQKKADEALLEGFIIEEERREVLKGNITLDGNWIMNVNSDIAHLPLGVWFPIYTSRAEEILTDRLLGTY